MNIINGMYRQPGGVNDYCHLGAIENGPRGASNRVLRCLGLCLEIILTTGILVTVAFVSESPVVIAYCLLGALAFFAVRIHEMVFREEEPLHRPATGWGWTWGGSYWPSRHVRPVYVYERPSYVYAQSYPVYPSYRPYNRRPDAGWTRWRPGVPNQA